MNKGREYIALDKELIDAAQRVTGIAIKRVVVEFALRELVRLRGKGKLSVLDLSGMVDFDASDDPKADWDRKL